jgi:uncharacterized repeat protein (TIGR01451 family)
MVPGPSARELVPAAPKPTEDRISQILFGQLFKPGPTEYIHIGASGLKGLPPLPTGYVLFKDLAYRVKTEAIISGSQITVFSLPSVESETDFNNLSILHLKDDEMSPDGRSWNVVTVLPEGWDEHFHFVSKAQYDAFQPGFRSRRVAAITEEFGIFAIALNSQSQSTAGFTKFEVVPSSSPEPAKVGDQVIHTIVVKNKGSNAAAEVNLKISLNPYLEFVSVNSSQEGCKQSVRSSDRVLCHLGEVRSGGMVTIKVISRVADNPMLTKNVSELGNFLEVIFKENPTDFVEADNQILIQFNTPVVRGS